VGMCLVGNIEETAIFNSSVLLSLGGALATLFGAYAAASKDPRIPKPVSIIVVAAPKSGNRQWQKAFKVRAVYCSHDKKLNRVIN